MAKLKQGHTRWTYYKVSKVVSPCFILKVYPKTVLVRFIDGDWIYHKDFFLKKTFKTYRQAQRSSL